MFSAPQPDEHESSAWRMLAPFVGLFLLLILFAGGGMLVIAKEADLSDAARARDGVARTFAAQLAYLDAAVQMNAGTTEVANFLKAPDPQPSTAYTYFGFTNRMALGYFGTLVLNGDGTALAGTYAGQPWTGAALAEAARLVAPIAAGLSDRVAETVHGLLRDPSGRVVAVASGGWSAPQLMKLADQELYLSKARSVGSAPARPEAALG